MKNFIKIGLVLAIIAIVTLIGCVSYGIFNKANTKVQNPIVTMEIEGYGTIKIELYPDEAPNTVANFIKLTNNGFYNDLKFHRIIKDFMIQGGDVNGDGTGKGMYSKLDTSVAESNDYEYSIKGEFLANGFKNLIRHKKGVISMARSDYSSMGLTEEGYNSASTQFFIMTSDNTSLDGTYAPFGKVIEGYDIVEKIAGTEVQAEDEENNIAEGTPVKAPVITSVTVDTFGIDYGMPAVQKAFDYNQYLQETYGFDASGLNTNGSGVQE